MLHSCYRRTGGLARVGEPDDRALSETAEGLREPEAGRSGEGGSSPGMGTRVRSPSTTKVRGAGAESPGPADRVVFECRPKRWGFPAGRRVGAPPGSGAPRGESLGAVGRVGLLRRSGAVACPNLLQRRPAAGSAARRSAEYQRFSSGAPARSGPLQQIWTTDPPVDCNERPELRPQWGAWDSWDTRGAPARRGSGGRCPWPPTTAPRPRRGASRPWCRDDPPDPRAGLGAAVRLKRDRPRPWRPRRPQRSVSARSPMRPRRPLR